MRKCYLTLVLLLLFGITSLLFAQTSNQINDESSKSNPIRTEIDNIHYWIKLAEKGLVQFNPEVPVTPAIYKGSEITSSDFLTNSPDILVLDDATVTEAENSVFIDPNNNQHIFNANNSGNWTGTTVSTFYGSNYLFSANAGQIWTGSKNGAGGSNSGDPSVCIGLNGRRYNGFINNNAGQTVAYSDNETTWTNVVVGTSAGGYYDLLDKNHLWIDNTNSSQEGNLYNAWVRFESGHANNNEIEFSRSTNNGVSWSTPYAISSNIAAGAFNHGVNIQCNNTGWVFAVWVAYDDWSAGVYGEDAICFARSSNGGVSFLPAQRIHDNILGIRPSPYSPTVNPTGKNMRVNSFPSMAIDVSGGAYHGHQYIVWSNVGVPGINTGTNVSVYMIKSTNGGTIWSTPIKVNQGSSADGYASYFPWITCDPVTGNLYCVFYDDRNLGISSSAVETWLAYSTDGGSSWDDFRVSDVSFTPAPVPGMASGYMGDYIGVSARDGRVYPAWTDNRSGRALTYVSPLNFGGSCIATGGACDEYIANVNMGSINNSSSCNGYEDFRNLSTNVPLNASVPITVTNSTTLYPTDRCGIWVDWNRDDNFDPITEAISVTGTPGAGPYSATIAPPPGTTQGPCTMRVRINYNSTPAPCGTETYGEVEDYTINVTGIPGLWTGVSNTSWVNSLNWDDGVIPTSATAVTIPSGSPNYPVLGGNLGINTGTYTYDCASLNINPGATVTLNGGYDVYNYGALIVGGSLNIGDDIFLYSGSTVSLSGTINLGTYIGWYGEAFHNSGSVFNQTAGNYNVETLTLNNGCQFNGTGGATHIYVNGDTPPENTIQISDPDSYFYEFYVDAGANAVLFNCTYDLQVNFATYLYGPLTTNAFTLNSQYMDAYTGGNLIINSGGVVNIPGNGPWFHNGGSLTMGSGSELNSGSSIWFQTGSVTNVSGGEIFVGGPFTDSDEIFTPTAGSVTFDGGTTASITGPTSFNNLIINKPSGVKSSAQYNNKDANSIGFTSANNESLSSYEPIGGSDDTKANDVNLASNVTVSNDLTINSGIFNANTFDIYVAGDWVNNVGTEGFTESTGRVIFNGGNYHQYCSNETFNILEINKPLGGSFRVNGTNVVCAAYDWTAGAVDVLTGTFTANDLLDNGISGAFYNNTGGAINLTNSGTGLYVDLNGELHIFGGTVTITGSISDWPFSDNASIEMSGGALDFPTCGIGIYNDGTYTFTHNITGGTIRTAEGFYGSRADFTPTAGTFEFYGSGDAYLYQDNGCTLWDVHINSAAKSSSLIEKTKPMSGERIDITAGDGGKANSVLLGTEFTIANILNVSAGTFNLNSQTANILGGVTINGGTLLVNDNASLLLENGTTLNVNSGGVLHAIGSSGNEAIIKAFGPGFYNFYVNPGGTMGGEYAIFENMSGNGVFLTPGSFVDPIYSFNYCTFQNGTTPTLFNIATNQSFTSVGANFPSSGGIQYNTYKWSGSTGQTTFLDAVGAFAGEDFDYDPNNYINWTYTARTLALTVFMEGPFNSGTNKMDTDINDILPLNQPFNPILPYYGNPLPDWYYTGSENVGAIPNIFVVDWVLVQLRDAPNAPAATPGTAFKTIPAFVLNTGEIVALDGLSPLTFLGTPTNDLFVAIWHRNHLGILSASALVDAGGVYTYDFSSGSGQAHGGIAAQVQLSVSPVVWGMISGDGDGNGSVGLSDKLNIWYLLAGQAGYNGGDFNNNRQVNNQDKDDFWFPNLGAGSFIPE